MIPQWKVPLFDLDYGPEERDAVLEVLDRRWLTMGEVTQQFEVAFGALVGLPHAFAVGNATQALHLACLALGIGPGDEVIVPSLSFVATANAVRYTGAEVRFADIIGPHNLTISPESIAAQITPRTKAIIVMHYAGYPCDMPAIMKLAGEQDLAVIEDAAHSPGGSLGGRPLGAWGDVGCFSFFSNKNLAVGEGGMLVTGRADIAEQVRLLRSHGMTSLTLDRHKGHAYTYDVLALGYNYRMDEMRCALGLVQLGKLGANNQRRAALTHAYWDVLAGTGLDLPFAERTSAAQVGGGSPFIEASSFDYQPAYHILPVLLPPDVPRLPFIDHMRSHGIQTSIHYPPIHTFTAYQQGTPLAHLPHTEAAAAREITLPLYPTMTGEQLSAVVAAICQGL